MDETTDVIEREDGEGLILRRWGDLVDLGHLSDDIVVRYHNLRISEL